MMMSMIVIGIGLGVELRIQGFQGSGVGIVGFGGISNLQLAAPEPYELPLNP